MNKIIQEFLRSGKITVSLGRVSVEGGAAIAVFFVLAIIILLR
jgi:hypothetical protein